MTLEPAPASRAVPRWPRRVRFGLAALPLGAAALLVARAFPGAVERVYSAGVYPQLATALGSASALVSFSVAEIATLALPVFLLVLPALALRRARKAGAGWPRALIAGCGHALGEAGWIWCLFLLVWGLNFARERPETLFGLGEPLDDARRAELVAMIGGRLDALREGLEEDADGVVVVPGTLAELDARLGTLQDAALRDAGLPPVAGGRAKPLLGSRVLLRFGVAGVYGPFTGEPNVVLPAPPARLPFVVAHERAHHAGFAWEEAASFVALLTLWRAEDPALRYAGWLSLWVALRAPREGRSAGVRRDLDAMDAFLARHVGKKASRNLLRAYGKFLEAHGVEGGTASYGRVGELALRHLDRRGPPGRGETRDPKETGR